MKKIKYIHIGMPKNLSTTLQRDFFSAHPEIMHLGVGVGSNVDYISSNISAACENHFQYSKNLSYKINEKMINENFDFQFQKFYQDSSKKACGISLELLSFTFTPDQIEIEEKARRVFNAFGKNSKVIIIVREQFKLIESLYKESIKIGFYGTFQDYLNYIYYSRDKNFIYDFNYDYLFDVYSKYFGKENMIIIPIENFRHSSGELIYDKGVCALTNHLSKKLEITSINTTLNHHNKPLSNSELYSMRILNRENIHGIGNQSYSTGTNFHRLKDYFREELNINIHDDFLYHDARVKNSNIKKAQQLNNNKEIEFEYPLKIKEFLKNMFVESNQKFQEKIGFDLPEEYLTN